MNELQIRLTADIQGLQSALAKAKQTLKSFESETATDSEKSNVGFRRKIGLIEQLNIKAKELKVSITQATNEQKVARLNAELQQTTVELTRLNALGKSFANTSTQSFNNFRVSAGAAGGSAIAFNRIIQDAPFGIIGVGNNIQQFAEQLTALKATTGSTGAAIRTFFTSLISPANLVVLGVSAITAAWTAYSLSASNAKKETKDVNDELQDYIKTLDGVDRATLDSTISTEQEILKFQTLASVLSDTNSTYRQRKTAVDQIQSGYGQYLGNLTDEEILVKGLGIAYDNVISALIAKSALEANAKEINKNIKETAELSKKRNDEEQRYIQLQELLQSKRANLARTEELIDSGEIKGTKRRDELKAEIQTILETQNAYNVSIDTGTTAIEKNEASLKTLVQGYTGSLKALLSYDKGQKDAAESGNKLNRVFDEQILLVERFGSQADDARKKLESLSAGGLFDSLSKEQKSLFEQITTLQAKGPINVIDAIAIELASKRLAEIDKIIGSIASKREGSEIQIDPNQLLGLETPQFGKGNVQKLEDEISSLQARIKVTVDPEALARYQQQLELAQNALSDLLGKRKLQVEDLTQAFVGLGSVIGRAFKNPQLGTFVSQFASFVGQIVAGAFAVAKANAVAGATQSSLFTGPAAAFTLPAFIAASVGVVASAFAALGNFGGGGGTPSAGTGSTFTNRREFGGPVSKGRAYIVGEKRPELFVPNTNGIIVPQLPSMDYSGASMAAGAMAVDVNIRGISYGDDILFTVQQAQIRRGIR